MKFLVCLFAVLAVANAGYLAGNNVYGSGLYGSGSYISNPVQYVNAAPAVQVVRSAVPAYHAAPVYHSAAPAVQVVRSAVPAYHAAPVYHSAPVVQSQIVSSPIVSAPVYRSSPIISSYAAPLAASVPIAHSYGLSYGPRYASNYGIGAGINVVKAGYLKQ